MGSIARTLQRSLIHWMPPAQSKWIYCTIYCTAVVWFFSKMPGMWPLLRHSNIQALQLQMEYVLTAPLHFLALAGILLGAQTQFGKYDPARDSGSIVVLFLRSSNRWLHLRHTRQDIVDVKAGDKTRAFPHCNKASWILCLLMGVAHSYMPFYRYSLCSSIKY